MSSHYDSVYQLPEKMADFLLHQKKKIVLTSYFNLVSYENKGTDNCINCQFISTSAINFRISAAFYEA